MNKKQLFKKIKTIFGPEDLDETVYELKSNEASAINNSGIDAQIDYLYKAAGKKWIEEYFLNSFYQCIDHECPDIKKSPCHYHPSPPPKNR